MAERLPYTHMYEYSLTETTAIVGVFILMQFFVEVRYLGSLVTGLTVLLLGVSKVNFYVAIVPLPPALDTCLLYTSRCV